MKGVIDQLPPSNQQLLRYLARFLHSVCKNNQQNQMNSHSLAVIFGPIITPPVDYPAHIHRICEHTRLIIENPDKL